MEQEAESTSTGEKPPSGAAKAPDDRDSQPGTITDTRSTTETHSTSRPAVTGPQAPLKQSPSPTPQAPTVQPFCQPIFSPPPPSPNPQIFPVKNSSGAPP